MRSESRRNIGLNQHPVTLARSFHLLLQQYQPTRSLRSGSQNLLALTTLSSEFGRHAFSYCAPSVWNLVTAIHPISNSFNSFKSYPEGRSTIHEPGRRELPTQSYVRPLSWLDSKLSRQEPEEDLVPASCDEGL